MQNKKLAQISLEPEGILTAYDIGNDKISLELHTGQIHYRTKLPCGIMCLVTHPCAFKDYIYHARHNEKDKKRKILHFFKEGISIELTETNASHVDRLLRIIEILEK